ncbi:MAG TPA: cell division protein FtsL [Acidobacteriaceae bacterium]|nr:cell division protein FtsL [Acidobacteriaceae bacterium]
MATMAMAGQGLEQMQARRTHGRTVSIAERNRDLFEAQRARRRGPTPEMFFTKHLDNTRLVKADDPERHREMRTFTMVMTLLFALTMVYVWQHFSAIEVGYNVEAQKQQVEQLREQNRQLRLSEAQLSDPGRIDQIAKQLGLNTPLPGQVVRPDGFGGATPVLAQAHEPSFGATQ